jgi:hypothetical protein
MLDEIDFFLQAHFLAVKTMEEGASLSLPTLKGKKSTLRLFEASGLYSPRLTGT